MLQKTSWGLLFFSLLINNQLINALNTDHHSIVPTPSEGISFSGSLGITEHVADIMARPPVFNNIAAQQKQAVRPKLSIQGRQNLAQHPRSAQIENDFLKSLTLADQTRQTTRTVQTIGLNFLAAQYSESGFVPPDADGAVGLQQYLMVASGIVKTFSKSTGALDGVIDTSLDNFFASVLPSGSFVGDVRVFYDTTSQRFFVVGRSSNTATERLLIAVSASNVITAQSYFTFFYLNTASFSNGLELDYPTLGSDNNALYIGANLFDSNSNFVNSIALVIQKSSILGNGHVFYTAFNNLINSSAQTGQVSPVGVNNFDQNSTQGFFIGVSAFYYGALVLNIINNPGSNHPTISAPIVIPVAPTAAPLLVPHKGNTNGTQGLIGPTDDRLNWSHIRNGTLWTCHNTIGVNNTGSSSGTLSRDAIRWYQINMSNPNQPAVLQYGTLYNNTAANDSNELNYFVGSIMTSGQGHALVGSSVGGTNSYLNAVVAGHLATDSSGLVESPIAYTTSSSAYNLSWDLPIYGAHRWGDYSTISIDPADNMTMWSIQEYCNATNSWGLQVAKIIAPPPASIVSVSPATVQQGSTSTIITITGQSTNGSGFYDPGTGFTNRLQVAISGGVRVTSITYSNPTTITATLDTTSATAGLQSITVTNPDGQHVTSSNSLSIAGSNTGPTGATGAATGQSGSTGLSGATGSSGISGSSGPRGINNIYLGTSGVTGESNTIRIGNPNTQTNCYIQGIYQAPAGNNPLLVQIGSEGKLSTVAATGRNFIASDYLEELVQKIDAQDKRIDELYNLVAELLH